MSTSPSSTSCDKIDVKRIGCIQDIGVVLKIKDEKITSISDNAYRYPWITVYSMTDVVGKYIKDIVTESTLSSINHLIKSSLTSIVVSGHMARVPNKSKSPDITVTVTLQNDGGMCICFEPVVESCLDKGFIHMNMDADSVDSCCEYLRTSMCYDRGLVYKFFDDSTGEVVFESVTSGVKYKGLRFPSGDVPVKARKQYMTDRVRFISDTGKPQSRIMGDEYMDLTSCNIRGVASQHMDYMTNMGVRSSLSIGLVVNDDLWGLLVFHAWNNVIVPSSHDIYMMTMTSSMISSRLEKKLNSEYISRQLELENLLSGKGVHDNVGDFIVSNEEILLKIFKCNTLCYSDTNNKSFQVVGDNSVSLEGIDTLNIESACSYGSMENPRRSYVSINNPKFVLIFIRMGYTTDIYWGGDPDKKILNPVNGDMIPRKSFEAFIKKTLERPSGWNKMDRSLVKSISQSLDSMVYQKTLCDSKSVIRDMKSKVANAIDSNMRDQSFFAHMSHELRTPFHGVMSILYLIQNGQLNSEETKRYVDMAIECGDTMLNTLNDILSISKGKSGHESIVREFDLMSVVNSTTDVLNQTASAKGITVETLFEIGQMTSVKGDAILIKQIIANFYSNAIKFTDNGGKVVLYVKVFDKFTDAYKEWEDTSSSYDGVHVSTDPYPNSNYGTDHVHVSISVTDTGCGLRRDDIAGIFNAYHQVSSGEDKVYQGSGLGLNICMINANSLNARLSVLSTHKEGTCMNCIIPLEKTGYSDKVDVTNVDDGLRVLKHGVTNTPVFLVVDDSYVNVKLAIKHIKMGIPGATVQSSSNGLEGYNMFKGFIEDNVVINGILMDNHMPIMSGIDSIMKIREYETRMEIPSTPIIAFTADLTETSRSNLLGAGADRIIEKPMGRNVVANTCIDILNSSRD